MPRSKPIAVDLTAEELRRRLSYDADTGVFTWLDRNPTHAFRPGQIAGRLTYQGYVQISIAKRGYMAHRLAWLYTTGAWPTAVVDHIDGDKANNRFANLRDVSISINTQNQRRPHSRNTTGYLGVCFSKAAGKFQASIYFDKKLRHLGLFETAEQASAAYLNAKRAHHEGNTL